MAVINEITKLISSEKIEDILNMGYIDRDESTTKFVPSLNTIFFEFESRLLRFHRSQNTNFEIDISLIGKSELYREKQAPDIFEEYEFCISSLSNMFLYQDRIHNMITKIEAYSESEEDFNNGIVKCIGFEVYCNSYIFLNPLSWNCIEIGKREEKEGWLKNISDVGNSIIEYKPSKLVYKEWNK